MALHATYTGANGWLLEFEQPGASTLKVLLDPWLVGELRFLPGDWFFTGNYPTPGGNRVCNRAFMNYMEGKNVRGY